MARATTDGVQGPALGPLVESRGNTLQAGGSPGGSAPGSSAVLPIVNALRELS